MAPNIAATLSTEDLTRYRMLTARQSSYHVKPEGYSRDDIEQNEIAIMRFWGEVAERYGLDDTRVWRISANTGVIIYGEWED